MTATLLGANGKPGSMLSTFARLADVDWRPQARPGSADVIWSGDVFAPDAGDVFTRGCTLINMTGDTGADQADLESTNVRFVKDLLHKAAEAAVVGYPHDIKGQGIYAYVTLMYDQEPSEELRKELETWVRAEIGPIAKPDLIQWAPGLPKTRSGKIMRRILRKIAEDDFGALGDTSTLADSSVVDELIENRMNKPG